MVQRTGHPAKFHTCLQVARDTMTGTQHVHVRTETINSEQAVDSGRQTLLTLNGVNGSMMRFLLLAVVAALAGAVAHAVELDTLIVNGEQATYGDHPYICSLQRRQGFFYYHICGCVIYNRNTVITAAHCLDGASANSLRIQAGLHTISSVEDHQVSRTITKFKMHEYYNGNALGFPNDIATVQLSSPLTFNSYVSNITIDEDPNNSWEGQQCWLTGWGRKSGSGSTANVLKKVSMTKITNSDCASRWSSVGSGAINSGHICFYDPPRSACSGDSGGPVRCGNTLTGVTSWGPSSCSGDYPSVYTRLSTYASWMRNNAY